MKWNQSLRVSVFWRSAVAAIVPVMLIGIPLRRYVARQITDSIETRNHLLTQALAGEARGILHEPRVAMEQAAGHLHHRDPPVGEHMLSQILENIVDHSDYFESVFLVNEHGRVEHLALRSDLISHKKEYQGIDISGQEYFKVVARTRKAYWSDAFFSVITGKLSLTLAVPVDKRILVGNFSVERLESLTDRAREGQGITAAVIDRKGTLFFHPDKSLAEQRLNWRNIEPVRRALRGEYDSMRYVQDGVEYVGSISEIPGSGWFVLVSQPVQDAYAPVRTSEWILLIGFFTAIILSGLAAAWLSHYLASPLNQLGNIAGAVADGDYGRPIEQQRFHELEQLAGAFRNMTGAIRERESSLVSSRQFLQTVIDTIPDILVVIDREHNIVLANETAKSAVGVIAPPDTCIKCHTLFHENDAPCPIEGEELCPLATCIETKEPIITHHTHSDGNGGSMEIEVSAAPILDENGEVTQIIESCRDITQRVVAEEALRESELRFRSMFEQAAVGIATVDLQGNILRANGKLAEITGYSQSELASKTVEAITHPDDIAKDLDGQRRLLSGDAENFILEKRYMRKDGSYVWVELTVSLVRGADGKPRSFIGIVEDISARKVMEEEKQELEYRLIQSQKMEAVGRLAGGIAHDFNNLLTPILCYSERLMMRSDLFDERARGNLEQVLHAGERAKDLVAQLLAFGRKQTLAMRPVDLNEVVAQSQKMLRRMVPENIEMLVSPGANVGTVMADAPQLGQVLMNLVINAVDAIELVGTINISTESHTVNQTTKDLDAGDYSLLIVSDSGSGMDEKTMSNIFEPFFTTKAEGQGTGLGLATVHGIVKQHGGAITVHSELGNGTTFRVYLPQTLQQIQETDQRLIETKSGSETILIVEDNSTVREITLEVLTDHGYSAYAAQGPREALELLSQIEEPIDLLLTDVIMPEMDGMELYNHIAGDNPGMLVIFMSGYTGDVIAPKGIIEEKVNFIQKPFSIPVLTTRIREILDEAK